jgi:hypothetical protein
MTTRRTFFPPREPCHPMPLTPEGASRDVGTTDLPTPDQPALRFANHVPASAHMAYGGRHQGGHYGQDRG